MAASLSLSGGATLHHPVALRLRLDPCAFARATRILQKPLTPNRFVIRAAKLPSGVDPPKEEPKLSTPLLGFTENAERWNSRAAMIGLFGLYFFELIIQKGFLELIGFEVGKGINIPL